MRRVALAVTLVLALTTAANASIIYQFVSLSPSGANFEWVYRANLSEDQKVNSNSFGTIFDFPGVITATSTVDAGVAASISVSTSIPATSAQAFMQAVPDSALILNVVTDIDGAFTPAPGAGLTPLYTVQIISNVGGPPVDGPFQSSEALKNSPGAPTDGERSGNTTSVEGPARDQQVVPEPGTLLLLGTSLVGLGGYARHRMRRKK